MTCEVCSKERQVVVICSGFGSASYATCSECLTAGAEPYAFVVAGLACCGLDAMHPEMVAATERTPANDNPKPKRKKAS